jgi:putative Mn2+ efflux pump MntP
MKIREYFEIFKKGLKEIPSCLFSFIKKLFPNAWFYGMFSTIPLLIAVAGMFLAKTFTTHATSILVFKILATIGQIIPLSTSLYLSEWELIETNEDSAEICFIICALVIAIIWQV